MKKYLILLLIPILLISLTACGNNNTNNTKDKKAIILEDTKLGLKTTFSYDEKDNYTDIEYSDEGASKEVEFANDDLDAEFQMYYNTISDTSYNANKTTRSNQKYYKEYKFGKYKAYAYSEYSNNIKLNILLKENENKMYDVLFVSIDRLDSDESIVMAELLDSDELQAFFKTIEFEKTSNKQQKK